MRREQIVFALSFVLCAAAAAVGVVVAPLGSWDLQVLVVVAPLVVAGDLVEITVGKARVAGGFLGLLLAAALLGPTQAACLGVAAIAVDTLRSRPRPVWAAVNLAAFSVFPMVAGLLMHAIAAVGGMDVGDPSFALAIVAGSAVGTGTNFLFFAAAGKIVLGEGLREQFRIVFAPILPSEIAMFLLSSLIVFAYARAGVVMLGMLVALFFVYIWLLRELLLSQQRSRDLDERSQQLASLQVGVLTAMLKTLSLRDHMTARHSAAVARYSRALAREAGCTEAEQELVHTAGLLHDIGKFIFPDRILLASSRLTDEDWEIVKCHPYQGAKIVRHVEGYGPVADIILGHHERIDGTGYPRRLSGEDIPLLSRIISISDTYDVMTARDSYRKPVPRAEAIAELRRVANAQLDQELVELFVGMVERGALAFGHGDDADFEAELQFERRVSEYAAPRVQATIAA